MDTRNSPHAVGDASERSTGDAACTSVRISTLCEEVARHAGTVTVPVRDVSILYQMRPKSEFQKLSR